jgi:alanine dehydrogenase
LLSQCRLVGELHHALAANLMTEDQVYAELGDVVACIKPGRETDHEVIIFDSTGTALQDVAVAAAVYEKAIERGRGVRFDLFGGESPQ